MFYRASYDQEEKEQRDMNRNEQYRWLIKHLNNPNLDVELEGALSEDDHIKFKSVCALRFIQLMHK